MTLHDLAREALEELRRTQFVEHERTSVYGHVWRESQCVTCGTYMGDLSPHLAMSGHLCSRTRLIADLEAALREAGR